MCLSDMHGGAGMEKVAGIWRRPGRFRYAAWMFGSHLSIAGGMHHALLEAERLRFDIVQVFTKNQQQWAAKPLTAGGIDEFRRHADRLRFQKIVAHASYLINLAAVAPGLWEKSVQAFADEMERCDQLGIPYLVIHPGAHCGAGEDAGVQKVVTALNRLLDKEQKNGRVTICLETTAGQGSCLGHRFEQLAEMIDRVDNKSRVGVCADTCHILAAGYDITTPEGTRAAIDEMDRTFGLDRLKVWHLNDSRKALGTRVDRHEHIGRGFVGLPAFAVIAMDRRFADTPKILETPKEKAPDGHDWDEVNLHLLRGLAAGKKMRLKRFPKQKPHAARLPAHRRRRRAIA